MIGLAKSAALELGEFGITVKTLMPGLVATPLTLNTRRLQAVMLQATHQAIAQPSAETAFQARARGEAPQVGWLQVTDISPMAVFLASDAAAMITGGEFEVTDGDSALGVQAGDMAGRTRVSDCCALIRHRFKYMPNGCPGHHLIERHQSSNKRCPSKQGAGAVRLWPD